MSLKRSDTEQKADEYLLVLPRLPAEQLNTLAACDFVTGLI